ncbi:Outer membrane usher protein [Nitrosomonas nitrosa]|uniref:Outer membrane usher protein n=1 Tax=Nitrosomonas nitrosa TaxID=52442 RepID=A0A8H8Z1Q7_9PROT|nr:fimbria/pilus outer membrane usher protein [Nitrosomonas nitrosa]CAE6503003.1 Outer membrane usher protein [Nitrosomonas nitrosa]
MALVLQVAICFATGTRKFARFSMLLLPLALLLGVQSTHASMTEQREHTEGLINNKTHPLESEYDNKPQILLLDVTINSIKLGDIVWAEQLSDGRLVLPVEAWQNMRLRTVGEKLTLTNGKTGHALDSIEGLQYQLDKGQLTLTIIAPAEAFEGSALDHGRGGTVPTNESPPGIFFNYNLTGTRLGDGKISYGAFLESVAFNRMGSLVAGGLARGSEEQLEFVRTDTYLQKDLPSTMETLILGDTIGTGGAWSRPVRFGGIRWARNFSLRPGYFTFPLPSISGSAALPSTIDVLINNQRQQSQTVEPGPFTLTNIPVVNGAGEISLVVRDMLGTETLVTQSYYASSRLLAKGLSDFSFEAGLLRKNFGIRSNDYGAPFFAGTWRQGFSDAFTGEARIEIQKQRQAAGIEMSGLLGNYVVARTAAAYARAEGEQGGRYLFGLERRSLSGSGSLQWEYFDRGYLQFAERSGAIRPRNRISASYGMPIPFLQGSSLGLSYISQSNWNGDPFKLASANIGISLPLNLFASIFVSKQLDHNRGWIGGINLMLPLGSQRIVSARTARDNAGRIINAVQASQSVPFGPGVGWRLRASDDPRQYLQAGGTLNTNYGQIRADTNLGENGYSVRLGANGSIGYLQDFPFATRNIGHGSFAVVKVGGLEGVPVYRSNQIVATTNSRGKALVPNLLPFQKNQISIDPGELPFNTEIQGIKEVVTPYARSGLLVEFPVRQTRNALVVLHQTDGSPVPVGASVTVSPNGLSYTVARRGQVYLTDLEVDNHITVKWQDGHCNLPITLPIDGTVEPIIGPLICGDSQ